MAFSVNLLAVVVNYRTSSDLRRFLETWTTHAPFCDWHLVVANVDPLENDLAVGDVWAGPHITHLPLEHNVGYARACNIAASSVEADVYAFFNADVWFKDTAVDSVLMAMEDCPNWGVVGPRQVDSAGRLTHAGIFGTHAAPKHRAWHRWNTDKYGDVQKAITVSGAAYFVRGTAWWQLANCGIFKHTVERLALDQTPGAFLPTPHYYEETWCSYHAWAHGWPVVYFGEAVVMHEWHRASPIGGYAEQMMGASRQLFRAACDDHHIPHD